MGYPHHIIQRGHNRQVVFVSDEDYRYYLDNLCEWKEKLGFKVYAYCLMTNHVLLIVYLGENGANRARLMKRIAGRQARYLNKLEKRTGSLWEGSFKSSTISADEYLLACSRYVELNPVRAGIVTNPTTQYDVNLTCLTCICLLYCETKPQKGGKRCYLKFDNPSIFTMSPSLSWTEPILTI